MPISNMKNAMSDRMNRSAPLVFVRANIIMTAEITIKPIPTNDTHIFIIGSIGDFLSRISLQNGEYYTINSLKIKETGHCLIVG